MVTRPQFPPAGGLDARLLSKAPAEEACVARPEPSQTESLRARVAHSLALSLGARGWWMAARRKVQCRAGIWRNAATQRVPADHTHRTKLANLHRASLATPTLGGHQAPEGWGGAGPLTSATDDWQILETNRITPLVTWISDEGQSFLG